MRRTDQDLTIIPAAESTSLITLLVRFDFVLQDKLFAAFAEHRFNRIPSQIPSLEPMIG